MRKWFAHSITQFSLKRSKLIFFGALAFILGGMFLGSKLDLQTDLSELLPPNASSVIQLKALSKRVGGTGSLSIALSGDTDALRGYVPQLAALLREKMGPQILTIRYQRKEVEDYFRKFAAYYIGEDELQTWLDKVADVLKEEKQAANPAYVDISGDPPHARARALVDEVRAAERAAGLHDLDASRAKSADSQVDAKTGILMTEGGHLAVLFVRPATSSLNLAASGSMLGEITKLIDGSKPPGVKLEGFTGSIPGAIAEIHAIAHDVLGTALLVVLLVGGVVAWYFRGVRELFYLGISLLIGIAFAFAFAYLWIGHVNAQTAFLGSIIVGTGINYGIILLARFTALRREGVAFEIALENSLYDTARATSIAALATAVSFGVLAAGEVESFHQFGWIGGLGILMCWVASITFIPAALVMFDQKRVYKPDAKPRFVTSAFASVGRFITDRPRPIIALAVLFTIACGVATYRRRNNALETNMGNLGTKSANITGLNKLDNRLRKMDSSSSSSAVIPTDSREEAEAVCNVLRPLAERTQHAFMGRCFTLNAILPPPSPRRLKLLGDLRRQLDDVPTRDLEAEDRKELTQLRLELAERVPVASDLPPSLSEAFRERDGSIGKLAFVEPHNDEVQANLYAFADAMRHIELPSGKVIVASGENVIFADILHTVTTDARHLTLAAALAVLLVLLIVTRNAGSFGRVGLALIVGVIWMVGIAAAMGERLNFFNFVALPTTFGIGIDYAINVEERFKLRGVGMTLAAALGEIGPPVALASLTTIFGYATLLIADNQALGSFGSLAIIGEITCLVAAIAFVPALWALRRTSTP